MLSKPITCKIKINQKIEIGISRRHMKRRMIIKRLPQIKYYIVLKVLLMMLGHLNSHLLTVKIIFIFNMIGIWWKMRGLLILEMNAKQLSRVTTFFLIRLIEQMKITKHQRIKPISLIKLIVKIILRVVTRVLCQISHLQQVPWMRIIVERWMSSKRISIKFIEKKMHLIVKFKICETVTESSELPNLNKSF